jgi:hypothetical protein
VVRVAEVVRVAAGAAARELYVARRRPKWRAALGDGLARAGSGRVTLAESRVVRARFSPARCAEASCMVAWLLLAAVDARRLARRSRAGARAQALPPTVADPERVGRSCSTTSRGRAGAWSTCGRSGHAPAERGDRWAIQGPLHRAGRLTAPAAKHLLLGRSARTSSRRCPSTSFVK